MSLNLAVWLAFAAIAATMLMSMVRRQQAKLHSLLEQNVEQQQEWLKKKARATRMAQRAARRKAKEEQAFAKSRSSVLATANQVAAELEAKEEELASRPPPPITTQID